MTIEILTDFDWDEVSKSEPSPEFPSNEYRSQVQTDLAGPSSINILTVASFVESEYLRHLKALFNREVDCIDCELIPVTVTSCEFDQGLNGKTTAFVKPRDKTF